MARETMHRVVSGIIYYFAFAPGIPVLAGCAILLSSLVPEGWQFGVAIVGALIGFGLIFAAFGRLRRWRVDKFYRLSFPTFRGERLPGFNMVEAEAGEMAYDFTNGAQAMLIGLSEEELFFMTILRAERSHERAGGKLLRNPETGAYWSIRRDALVMIDVFEKTDEALKAAAVDNRSYLERAAEGGASRLLGVKVKHKVVPYAAYLALTAIDRSGAEPRIERLTFAIPSEIDPETLKWIGIGEGDTSTPLIDAAVNHAVKKTKQALNEEAHDQLRDLVGDTPVDLADDIVDLKRDIDFWINLGGAKIGSTNGAIGRAATRILAERLRAWAGLPQVEVATLDT